MEETTNSIKDAIKERLTNPFLGKLLLAWILWNWKIPYISFFVSEENLIPENELEKTNKLEFVSNYLTPDSFWDFCNIYLVPFLITGILIWVVPWLSNIVFNVSEYYRKKKSLKIKETDNDINGYVDDKIKELQEKIDRLNKTSMSSKNSINEYKLLVKYLCEEKKLSEQENYDSHYKSTFEDYNLKISNSTKKDKMLLLIRNYNRGGIQYLNALEQSSKDFLLEYDLVKVDNNRKYELTELGIFISKNISFQRAPNRGFPKKYKL